MMPTIDRIDGKRIALCHRIKPPSSLRRFRFFRNE
jgi:hypothetical protein